MEYVILLWLSGLIEIIRRYWWIAVRVGLVFGLGYLFGVNHK